MLLRCVRGINSDLVVAGVRAQLVGVVNGGWRERIHVGVGIHVVTVGATVRAHATLYCVVVAESLHLQEIERSFALSPYVRAGHHRDNAAT